MRAAVVESNCHLRSCKQIHQKKKTRKYLAIWEQEITARERSKCENFIRKQPLMCYIISMVYNEGTELFIQ